MSLRNLPSLPTLGVPNPSRTLFLSHSRLNLAAPVKADLAPGQRQWWIILLSSGVDQCHGDLARSLPDLDLEERLPLDRFPVRVWFPSSIKQSLLMSSQSQFCRGVAILDVVDLFGQILEIGRGRLWLRATANTTNRGSSCIFSSYLPNTRSVSWSRREPWRFRLSLKSCTLLEY